MENRFTKSCIDVLKREDVRTELKNVMKPLDRYNLDRHLSIYLYFSYSCSDKFYLHLGIFILLLRKN